jgi:predicted TIM-barrel fold metal-dependent hydrolase
MPKTMHETHRLKFDGAVDADGHILEPPDLWETYLEPKYRDRALRIVRDENGLEELEIADKRSQMSRRGFPSTLGAMGDPDLRGMQFDPERTYMSEAPFGSMDPDERLKVLDAEGIDAAVLYTTVGLLWEVEVEDPDLAQAYTRAYNRWICEFCSGSDRLVPAAHLSLSDPAAAAVEMERAVDDGARGCYVAPFTHNGKPLGHPDHDVVFAPPRPRRSLRHPPDLRAQWTKGRGWVQENVTAAPSGVGRRFRRCAPSVHDAVRLRRLRKFPSLKVLVLESGGGWIGYWLDRIDAVFGHTFIGHGVPLKHKPVTTPRASGSRAIPTSAPSRRSPSASAPTASCGRPIPHAATPPST